MTFLLADEFRSLVLLNAGEVITDDVLKKLLEFSAIRVTIDIGTSEKNDITKYVHFLLAKHHYFRALAARALKFGYIEAEAQGRKVKKAYEELKTEAQEALNEYDMFIKSLFRKEVGATEHIANMVSNETLNKIKDTMQGLNNAQNLDRNLRTFGTRTGGQ